MGIEHGLNICQAERTPKAVDAYDPFNSIIGLRCSEQSQCVFTGLLLIFRRDPILELYADNIGPRGQRFWKHVWLEARRENKTPPRPRSSFRCLVHTNLQFKSRNCL